MSSNEKSNGSILMGHDMKVAIDDRGTGGWNLVFKDASEQDHKAPPLKEVEVEAIDETGTSHPLTVHEGSEQSIVAATGNTKGARRARVKVWMDGTHWHTREAYIPGVSRLPSTKGPNGGSLVKLTSVKNVEVLPANESRWDLVFFDQSEKGVAPSPSDVKVEAIGPRCEDYQLRHLQLTPGADPSTLVASGKIGDADHIRLTVKDGTEMVVRTSPVSVSP